MLRTLLDKILRALDNVPKSTATTYRCSVCHRPVAVQGGQVSRLCNHTDAVIVAEMSAVCVGRGKASLR